MRRMWKYLGVLTVLIAVTGCDDTSSLDKVPAGRGTPADWVVDPGVRAGALNRYSSVLDLARAYGTDNMRDSSITLGEGESTPGTLLFPDDPARRLEIIWRDAAVKREPRSVVLRGERSRWMLPGGVSLGTSLADLERVNGRPFHLAGFAWDYAGAVTSWGGGALDSLLPGVKLYLEPRIEDRAGPRYRRLQGDRDFESTHPDMKLLEPRVYQIRMDFSKPTGESGASR